MNSTFKSMIGILIATVSFGAENGSPINLDEWCSSLQKELTTNLKWRQTVCSGVTWKADGKSNQGWPLVYAEFGDFKTERGQKNNTTLVLAMVHPDEVTPLFIGIELASLLKDNPKMIEDGSRVIIAPLVNPDGFFRQPKTRTNAHGVDVNRNFDTQDWEAQAQAEWKKKFHSDPRRNPGAKGGSELETQFQKRMIEKFKPDKILSIHSPLNHLDYDGPNTLAVDRFSRDYVKSCLTLRSKLKAVATGFFPGSLGNYAGQELGIPTLTLELPTANPRKARVYWNQFRPGIETMIQFKMPEDPAVSNKS